MREGGVTTFVPPPPPGSQQPVDDDSEPPVPPPPPRRSLSEPHAKEFWIQKAPTAQLAARTALAELRNLDTEGHRSGEGPLEGVSTLLSTNLDGNVSACVTFADGSRHRVELNQPLDVPIVADLWANYSPPRAESLAPRVQPSAGPQAGNEAGNESWCHEPPMPSRRMTAPIPGEKPPLARICTATR